MQFILLFLLCLYANGATFNATLMPSDFTPEETKDLRQLLLAKQYYEYTNDEASSIASHIYKLVRLTGISMESLRRDHQEAPEIDPESESRLDLRLFQSAFSSIRQSAKADEKITLDPWAPKSKLILACQYLFEGEASYVQAGAAYNMWHREQQDYCPIMSTKL
ncbi:MAG: hypothetical protein OXC30_00130 [Alphaproteobacteria bacterium]|nr:hypothetical protein [Alphaproteobacteria bacterium]